MPESLLFSQLDAVARGLLAKRYDADIMRGLSNSTFRGARANALLVRWTPHSRTTRAVPREVLPVPDEPEVIRGGLPLFEARGSKVGLPLIHTTSLAALAASGSAQDCRKVKSIARGVVSGTLLLLPRVGIPLREQFRVVRFSSPAQLSDCVFALRFSSVRRAETFRKHALANWESLIQNYHGTGARYISVETMHAWVRATCKSLGWL